jgi:hypothetical protein
MLQKLWKIFFGNIFKHWSMMVLWDIFVQGGDIYYFVPEVTNGCLKLIKKIKFKILFHW